MSLAEKRARQNIETDAIPTLEGEIKTFCPTGEIKIEIDWDSFEADPDVYKIFSSGASARADLFSHAVGSTIAALERICYDEAGREALAEGVQTIRVVHEPGLEAGTASLEGGVITIQADVKERAGGSATEIRTAIEEGL